MKTDELVLFMNEFGVVTDKRITLHYKSGSEDISIGQASAVKFEHERNYFFAFSNIAVVIMLIVYLLIQNEELGGMEIVLIEIFTLLLGISGIANWIGHYNIVINIAGERGKPLKVEMAKTDEGEQFADAARKAIQQSQNEFLPKSRGKFRREETNTR